MYLFENLKMYFREPASQFDDAVCLQYGIFREGSNTDQDGEVFKLKLIPNPASNNVDIMVYPVLLEACRITISNTLGEVVYSATGDIATKLKSIDVSALAQGIYVVCVRNNTVVINARMTITH